MKRFQTKSPTPDITRLHEKRREVKRKNSAAHSKCREQDLTGAVSRSDLQHCLF